MQTNELELYTSRELINELMRRNTFLGVVIHSTEDVKSRGWTDERVFSVHYNSNLDAAEVARLLDVIASRVQLHE
jgi:hypothetical protein